MLPVFTTQQVKDGIGECASPHNGADHSDLMLDLSDYMKKKDVATKSDLETLDKQSQHKHIIDDVDQLQTVLDTKFNKNNVEQIPFIERPRVEVLEVSENKNVWGYRFYVNSSGNLVIISPNDVEIASYSNSSSKWSFETDLTEINNTLNSHAETLNNVQNSLQTKINSVESIINELRAANGTFAEYITKTDAVLKNHYDALVLLCEKHEMVGDESPDGI